MENKKFIYTMFNSKNEEEEIVFEVKPMASRWQFTERISEANKVANGDQFKISFEIAKRIFPSMIVSPEFPKTKIVQGKTWEIGEQIKEFFENDPQTLSFLVNDLLGFMKIQRKKTDE
ncbi:MULTISPECIES: hypothetical protein [Fusobacterium]|jgi:hypothetical protein|uniref:hypothetical protein n=1 Tax=Fusobacterium TaxID=848 RepID=UPI000E8F146C|nr:MULTISPECIES: hypothetical protein [Fusobacterium]DAE77848.1 MAG TPA: hypothetical protein [Caudoviricetes sp.]HBJ79730.1 hypothetical protein [Fusobacterium sp.]